MVAIANCTFTMSSSSGTYPGGALGQTAIPLTVSGGCTWTATSDSAWLYIVYGYSFELGQNDTGSTRTGHITTTDADGNVVATYTVTQGGSNSAVITLYANPVTGGAVTGAGVYSIGSQVQISATPSMYYTFANWAQGGNVVSTSASYAFTLAGNETLVANFTANTSTVTGQVTRSCDNSPVAGATVQIGTYSATTSSDGGYTINNVNAGTYTATISKAGYTTITTSVTLTVGQNLTQNFTLTPLSGVSGFVYDACDNQPVSGATVQVGSSTATTGVSGKYTLTGLAFGSYTVTAAKNGYSEASITADVSGCQQATVANILLPETGAIGTITFYGEPGPSNPNIGGHAFISLTGNGVTQYYGFYPLWPNEMAYCPGFFNNDAGAEWDWSISYPITCSQYRLISLKITTDLVSPPLYQLSGLNCMAWAASVANLGGIQLPDYIDYAGIADPVTFRESLSAIGDGNSQDGGTVTHNGLIDPPTPYDYSYSGVETFGHTNALALANLLNLTNDIVNLSSYLSTLNANSTNGLTIYIFGENTNTALISMSWGDGSAFQEQMLSFSHVYSAGTYAGNLLIVDTNAVHLYTFNVTVSPAPGTVNTINVTQFYSTPATNQHIVPAGPVPGFAVVQTTSISISNNYPIVNLFGIPTWSYTIRASTNLLRPFVPIGSAVAGPNGVFQFQDPTVNSNAMKFYKASYP